MPSRALISFTYWIYASALLAAGLLGGCNDARVQNCEQVITAIQALARDHLSEAARFSEPEFRASCRQLRASHELNDVALESERGRQFSSLSTLQECIVSMEAIRRENTAITLDTLTIELLDLYLHKWDAHSSVVAQQELAVPALYESGYGFSARQSTLNRRVEIVDVIAGSPAHQAGLVEGARVLRVGTTPLLGTERDIEVLDPYLRDRTQPLALTVSNAEGRVSYHLIAPATYEVSPIALNVIDSQDSDATPRPIGMIRIRSFAAINAFFSEGLRSLRGTHGLVLDLRDVAGGDVRTSLELADQIIAGTGPYTGFWGRGGALSEPLLFTSPERAWDKPIVALVNSQTKSAAEMLAGALQDYGTLVVGSQTFGKGTRQIERPLSTYGIPAVAYLTNAFTVRPSGSLIQLRGITPDIELPTEINPRRERHYAHALPAPRERTALPGYDTARALRVSLERANVLGRFRTDLRARFLERVHVVGQEQAVQEAAAQAAAWLSARD